MNVKRGDVVLADLPYSDRTGSKSTQIRVEFIMELVASWASRDNIVQPYLHLAPEDIDEALRYADHFLEIEVILSAEVGQ